MSLVARISLGLVFTVFSVGAVTLALTRWNEGQTDQIIARARSSDEVTEDRAFVAKHDFIQTERGATAKMNATDVVRRSWPKTMDDAIESPHTVEDTHLADIPVRGGLVAWNRDSKVGSSVGYVTASSVREVAQDILVWYQSSKLWDLVSSGYLGLSDGGWGCVVVERSTGTVDTVWMLPSILGCAPCNDTPLRVAILTMSANQMGKGIVKQNGPESDQ